MSALPGDALWERLRAAGLAHGEAPREAAEAPWFVRLMLGIAGWIGALFLFGFFGAALHDVLREASARLFLGALLCAGAAVLFRAGRPGELLGQFGLAVSLAGQGLLATGIAEAFRASAAAAAIAIAAQQAILFVAVPGSVHRVWTAASGGYALAFALGKWGLGACAAPALTAAFALAWLREFAQPRHAALVRAAGYGLGAAALLASMMHAMWLDVIWERSAYRASAGEFWTAAALNLAVVAAMAAALLRREGVPLSSRPGMLAMLGALIVGAAAAKAPGLAPAAALLVLGHANGNRVLAGLGIAALLAYLSYYYYSMQATLLEKSALLAAAGAALLVARVAMARLLAAGRDRDA